MKKQLLLGALLSAGMLFNVQADLYEDFSSDVERSLEAQKAADKKAAAYKAAKQMAANEAAVLKAANEAAKQMATNEAAEQMAANEAAANEAISQSSEVDFNTDPAIWF